MNASTLATADTRHMIPAPARPPEGRRYLGPDETLQTGDILWDGTEGNWTQGAVSFTGIAARHFMCVCRRASANAPSLKSRGWVPGTPRKSRRAKAKAQLTTAGTGKMATR